MTAAAGAAMALLAVFADGFSWPGATAVDAADLESLDRGQRQRAVERLGRPGVLGEAETRRLLAPLLTDSDAGVRAATGRVLLRAGAPEAAEAALRWLTAPSPVDRPAGLALFRDAPALPPPARAAVERCLRDTEVTVRLAALDVLARHGPAPSFMALATALDDEQREVRLRVVRLLEDARDRRAVTLLLGRLADSDRQVNLEAIGALGTLGDAGAAPALARTVDSGADDVRLAAIDALGTLGWAGAVPMLAPIARRRPSDEAGHRALLALGQIASPAAVTLLVERLRAPPVSDDVREALRRAGSKAVAPLTAVLEGAGHDAPTGAVAAAAAILGAVGDRRATAALAAIVDRRQPGTVEALQALAALRDPAALVALVRAAADHDADVRRLAFEALIAVGDNAGVAALAGGLADADRDVRRAALRLAARIDARAVGAAVLNNVAAQDAELRRPALVALATLPVMPPGALAALLAAAQRFDRTGSARQDDAEAQALGDALEAAVASDDAGAADAARRALGEAFAVAQGPAREPLLRGLCATLARGRPSGPDGVPRASVLAALAAGGALAETAADALVAAGLGAGDEADVIAAFDGAEASVRARLAPGLARVATPAALARLRFALDDDDEADVVRAAAAWAAAGVRDGGVRAALERRVAATRPAAVVANARAALAYQPAAGSERWSRWTGLRVLMPAGLGPLPRGWVVLRAEESAPVWAMTGVAGGVRVFGLPRGPVTVSAADAAWKVAGQPAAQR